MEDSFYVKKIKEGKTEYFEFIIKKYQSHIFNIVKKIINDYTASEDITQETFLKFFNSISSFDERNPLFPYLLRIAVNCTKDYIKKEKRQSKIKNTLFERHTVFKESEQLEEIYELICELPENQREILLLRYRDKKSLKEIAVILGISVSNAKVLLFRSRKALFELWKKNK